MDFFSVEGRAKECGADKATIAVQKVENNDLLTKIKITKKIGEGMVEESEVILDFDRVNYPTLKKLGF